MDDENKLKKDQTFTAQKDIVDNKIIPTVMEALDLETFPVSKSIVRNMIYSRHKHQREEYKIKLKPPSDQDKHNRRKHFNTRRNSVSNWFYSFFYILLCIFVILKISLCRNE